MLVSVAGTDWPVFGAGSVFELVVRFEADRVDRGLQRRGGFGDFGRPDARDVRRRAGAEGPVGTDGRAFVVLATIR